MSNWRLKWSKEQEELLANHIKNGGNDQELISNKVLPFSLNAIRKKKCRLNLTKKVPQVVRYKENIKDLFKIFLIKNWKNNTPEELVGMWNENHNTKTTMRKVISYLHLLKIKIPYSEIPKLKKYKKLFELQQYEKAREYKIDMFKQRLEIGLDLWTGLRLDKSIDVKEGMCPADEEDWF